MNLPPAAAPIDCELLADCLPRPRRLALRLPAGATVMDAVRAARAEWGESALDWDRLHTGIWGEAVRPDRPLAAGERVELYRSLPQDPRVARRARAGKRGR